VITLIAGARPNFVKIAPIQRELDRRGIAHRVFHTGQHDGPLDISDELGVRVDQRVCLSGAVRDITIIAQYIHDDLCEHTPTCVVVVGDVSSTIAGAVAATDLGIPVVHVEAGLRSGDWTMPEEWHRVAVDAVAARCLTSSLGDENGVRGRPWQFVGNVMVDSLHWALERIPSKPQAPYAVVTMHRPSNVDTHPARARTAAALDVVAARFDRCIWPMHPRARGLVVPGIERWDPTGYVPFIGLLRDATLVVTDSGGVQEETTALGVPCLTLRESTERPITVTAGTNTVVGLDPDTIGRHVDAVLRGDGKRGRVPDGWDGKAAHRIVNELEDFV
jgi:UDP-N-acetylglucosamine 2-epimerase (non-hydrolysing)